MNTHIGLRRSASPRVSCTLWSPPEEAHKSSCCRCSFASVRVVVVVEVMVMNNGHVVEETCVFTTACGRLCTRELESPNVCTKLGQTMQQEILTLAAASAITVQFLGRSFVMAWAAWYITRLLVKLTPKGVVSSFLFLSSVMARLHLPQSASQSSRN